MPWQPLKRESEISGEEIIEELRELVEIRTENKPPHGNEKPGQEWLFEKCIDAGLSPELYELGEVSGLYEHPDYWPREFSGRPNLIARWPGSGDGRSVLFSGHIDVVPPYPLPWNLHEPYDTVLEGEKLYGRGTVDMKGGLLAAFRAIKFLKQSGFKPKGDVLFESVVDEEYAGANGTLAGRVRGDNADFAIIPEGTGMKICPTCFGAKLVKIAIQGPAGMPYCGEEIYNPILGIGKVIAALKDFETHWNKISQKPPLFGEDKLNVIIYKLLAGDPRPDGQMTVPPVAWLSVIVQTYPGSSEEQVDKALNDFLNERLSGDENLKRYPPEISKEFRYMVPGETDPKHPGVGLLKDTGALHAADLPILGGPYSCDLFVFNAFGVPAVLLGPRGNNPHGKDEWVNVDDVLKLVTIYANFITEWCG